MYERRLRCAHTALARGRPRREAQTANRHSGGRHQFFSCGALESFANRRAEFEVRSAAVHTELRWRAKFDVTMG